MYYIRSCSLVGSRQPIDQLTNDSPNRGLAFTVVRQPESTMNFQKSIIQTATHFFYSSIITHAIPLEHSNISH